MAGYNRIVQQEAYKNYQYWIAPGTPRFLIVKLQHANPFYDDSYAVNSANVGPYGDAIETELIPAIEKTVSRHRRGWARFIYGGSTGGWESLAVQLFYPDHYNGAFVACPDPVDFHAYMTMSICTRSDNMFYIERREQENRAAGHARLFRSHAPDNARQHRLRGRAGGSWSLRRAVRHLAGGVFTRGRGRLSAVDLRQADRQDRP